MHLMRFVLFPQAAHYCTVAFILPDVGMKDESFDRRRKKHISVIFSLFFLMRMFKRPSQTILTSGNSHPTSLGVLGPLHAHDLHLFTEKSIISVRQFMQRLLSGRVPLIFFYLHLSGNDRKQIVFLDV